jgi:hypothetical protein
LAYEIKNFQLCPITAQYKTRSGREGNQGRGKEEKGRRREGPSLDFSFQLQLSLLGLHQLLSLGFSFLGNKKQKKEKEESEKHELI